MINNIYSFIKKRPDINKVSITFFIIGIIALIQAFNSIILGRILSEEDFGLYSFLFTTIVPLLSMIIVLGQPISIIRYFSKHNFVEYQWKKYLKYISIGFTVLIVSSVVIIGIIYELDLNKYIYLLLSITSFSLLKIIANFYRTRKKFYKAVLLERIAPPVFLFFLIILLIISLFKISYILILKTISYLLPFLIIFFFFIKNKSGKKKINKNIYSDGLLLWGIGMTMVAVSKIDGFFIVKYIDYKAIAVYSIIFLFTQIYVFASEAIWSIYSQKFSSGYRPNLINFIAKIAIVALLISLLYLVVGKHILHLLFNGKYDHGAYLILPFCIIGCLRLLYLYPSCYLIGKSSSSTLKSFLKLNILGTILKVIFLIFFIKMLGLLGAVISGIIIWIYRNVIGYILVIRESGKARVIG
ncbi:MAG: lipopolysaccharide biosynthesis protein [Candidatus Helarchaeota archaeon]